MKSMTLLVMASLLSFAAHAEDGPATNCDAKIKDLEYISETDGQALHGGMAHDFKVHLQNAKDAQSKGDMTQCQASADQAKTIYNKARSK